MLLRALERPRSPATLHELVEHCYEVAPECVERKVSPSHLRTYGLSSGDLAMDSISDLFKQSEEGELLRFQEYFGSVASDEAIPSLVTRPPMKKRLVNSANSLPWP